MSNYKKPYFVGIGGTGISNIAWYFLKRGIEVHGSDGKASPITDDLIKAGAHIVFDQRSGNIDDVTPDSVFYSQAVLGGAGKAEVDRAEELEIPTFRNAAGYWEVIGKSKETIAITGAHGKTTTTALTSLAFSSVGLDPVCIIGAPIKEFGHSSFRDGEGKYFIVEACEYREQFLGLERPKAMIILNIDHDHPDYYKDLKAVQEAFIKMAKQVDNSGFILACMDDPNTKSIIGRLNKLEAPVFTYGKDSSSNFVVATEPKDTGFGYGIKIVMNEEVRKLWPSLVTAPKEIEVSCSLPGEHNALNTAAAVVTLFLSSPQVASRSIYQIKSTLDGFSGSSRRQELIGSFDGMKVYDDYAHHPTQIKAVISAFKEKYPRLPVIFEAHDFIRTRELFPDFVSAFNGVDRLYMFPIYRVPGRNSDSDVASVNIDDMVEEIKKRGIDVRKVESYGSLKSILEEVKKDNYSMLLNLGAGPLTWELRKLLTTCV